MEFKVPRHILKVTFEDGRDPVDVDILAAQLAFETVDSRHGADSAGDDWQDTEAYYEDLAQSVFVEKFGFKSCASHEARELRIAVLEAYYAVKKNTPPPPESPPSTP